MPYADREDERAYRKKYYKLNKDKMKKRAKDHYEAHTEQHKKTSAEYRKTDAGKEVIKNSRASEKLERKKSTEQSIENKTYYKRWDYAEDFILLTMKENKNSWKEIATQLQRSLKSVEARYVKLMAKNKQSENKKENK